MSYVFDLTSVDPVASARDVLAWMVARPGWSMTEGGTPDEPWLPGDAARGAPCFEYANDATGVYANAYAPDAAARARGACLIARVNEVRPRPFALEAAGEFGAIARDLGLGVDDPEPEGMGRGAFDAAAMVRGWERRNLLGLRALLPGWRASRERAQANVALPAAEVEACWRWSYERDAVPARLGEDVFLPKFMYGVLRGRPVTMTTWIDRPMVAPRSDMVVLVTDDGAGDVGLLPWSVVEPHLRDPVAGLARPAWRLAGAPAAVFEAARRAAVPTPEEFAVHGFDGVIERETLEMARRLGPPKRDVLEHFDMGPEDRPARRRH